MSAQRLRDAAKVLRERAEDATPGPWAANARGDLNFNPSDLRTGWSVHFSRPANATFIATMHPGVALALADWLDDTATEVASGATYSQDALRVADLILGAQS